MALFSQFPTSSGSRSGGIPYYIIIIIIIMIVVCGGVGFMALKKS